MKAYQAIGIMSGSSLDGLDICAATFKHDQSWSYRLDHFKTCPFPSEIYRRLFNCRSLSGLELHLLDIELGKWIGDQVRQLIDDLGLHPALIGSHGHTVFHQVSRGLSLQIGNGHAIAQGSGLPVITDFRQANVLNGGQGAPLVPIGDALLFAEYSACINIGGIANVSIRKGSEVLAGDIVPANQVLNRLSQALGYDYDDCGNIARKGKINPEWLSYLNSLSFFKRPFPKSISNEWVQKEFLDSLPDCSTEDALHTFAHFVAERIAECLDLEKGTRVLITGGGALNTFLIELIAIKRPELVFEVPNLDLIQSKEALIFAFMGVLRWIGENNCLATYTGANKDLSAGVIYMP